MDLIAADQLGAARDGAATDEELAAYQRAFATIDADPAHILVVAEAGHDVVGTLQLSFIPGLARRDAWRAQVEAVRIDQAYRSGGLGTALMAWAIDESRRRGCALVQLTTDKSRTAAHRFYERLGFVASHEGMKLALNPDATARQRGKELWRADLPTPVYLRTGACGAIMAPCPVCRLRMSPSRPTPFCVSVRPPPTSPSRSTCVPG